MNAIKFETTVDEATARAMPALRPMLGKRVEVIAMQSEEEDRETSGHELTLQALLERRVDCPPGAAPLSDEDIQRAIVQGALDGNA
jgi:hypothetical protein